MSPKAMPRIRTPYGWRLGSAGVRLVDPLFGRGGFRRGADALEEEKVVDDRIGLKATPLIETSVAAQSTLERAERRKKITN
jgi:hypothetical protein